MCHKALLYSNLNKLPIMKKYIYLLFFITVSSVISAQNWKPQGDRIKTPWAAQVDPTNTLPEYPRPLCVRKDWKNLNGLWEYAITDTDDLCPEQFDGNILVPFPVESSLSGVMKQLNRNEILWYKRLFDIPLAWKRKNVILHFDAVDYQADVYLNGKKVTTHKGGYSRFSADITKYLKENDNVLIVKVTDPTDDWKQPAGKQRRNPGGPGSIWYTSVTGIWQTVWMEPVGNAYITDIKTTPDLDNARFIINVATQGANPFTDKIDVSLIDNGKCVASQVVGVGNTVVLDVKKMKQWTPENPFRYNLKITLNSNGTAVDEIMSYAAMRKISMAKDKDNIWRLQLNNSDYFHFGPLDQGYWPDGLYTAPTDEALLFDVMKTKEWGFNMIRKHMKVEPERWYYFCDSIGLLVWQDMPALGRSDERWEPGIWSQQTTGMQPQDVEQNFKNEWKNIINQLYSFPSIVVWTPFNEAWGQFKTSEIVDFTRSLDPTRLINPASGGNHYHCGDFMDLHDYSRPPRLFLYDKSRPVVLGEYGGLGRHVPGHRWYEQDATTYVNYGDVNQLTDSYVQQAEAVLEMAKGVVLDDGTKAAFSAAVYTQTTDVETEVNGLMTYDRMVMKMDEKRISEINKRISNVLNKK